MSFTTFINQLFSDIPYDPLLFLLKYEYFENNPSEQQILFDTNKIYSLSKKVSAFYTNFQLSDLYSREGYENILDQTTEYLHKLKLGWCYYYVGVYLNELHSNIDMTNTLSDFSRYLIRQTKYYFEYLYNAMNSYEHSQFLPGEVENFIIVL